MSSENELCPLRDKPCIRQKCAWWVVSNNDSCAVKHIAEQLEAMRE